MCPYNARLMGAEGGWTDKGRLVCQVLAIESSDGLVLVDTGLGAADVADPKRTGAFFRSVARPIYDPSETAVERLRGLGFAPADVRHIVLTHLDVDHAGGLGDFPHARVHLFRTELEAALDPSLRERLRYIDAQWAHGPDWVPYETGGDRWFGFDSVRAIEGLDVEIAIVPLVGHTRGHSGIAVRDGDRWLFDAGDSYFHHGEVATPQRTPPGLRIFEALTQLDRKARKANLERVRELIADHRDEVEVFCAHDRAEFERLGGDSSLPGER